jgi:hypothetical protein
MSAQPLRTSCPSGSVDEPYAIGSIRLMRAIAEGIVEILKDKY